MASTAREHRKEVWRLLPHTGPSEHAQVRENGCLWIAVAATQPERAYLSTGVLPCNNLYELPFSVHASTLSTASECIQRRQDFPISVSEAHSISSVPLPCSRV